MEKKKNKINFKSLEKVLNIAKIICIIFLILLIAVLALQRFSNNEQAIAGIRVFNVATGSMIPKYQVGDVLIVKEIDTDSLKIGDDITYLGKVDSFAGRVVTHQIIDIEETTNGKIFHTKGIANEFEDPTITSDQIYGKVIYKCIIISLFTKLMNNMAAFYIIFVVPLAILIFLQLKDNYAEKKEEYDDEEDEDEEEDDDDDDNDYEDEDEDDEEYDDEIDCDEENE